MGQISGQVAVVTKNRYGYGMKIEGYDNWFNSKQEIKCSKGDMVTFSSGSDGKSVYELTGGGTAAPAASGGGGSTAPAAGGGHDKRQTSIVRQNAITNANAFFANTGNKKYNLGDLVKAAAYIALFTEGNPMPPTKAEADATKAAEAERLAQAAEQAKQEAEAASAQAPSQDDVNAAMAAMDDIPF